MTTNTEQEGEKLDANIVGGDSSYSYDQKNGAEGWISETSHAGTVKHKIIQVFGGEHNTKRYCQLLNATESKPTTGNGRMVTMGSDGRVEEADPESPDYDPEIAAMLEQPTTGNEELSEVVEVILNRIDEAQDYLISAATRDRLRAALSTAGRRAISSKCTCDPYGISMCGYCEYIRQSLGSAVDHKQIKWIDTLDPEEREQIEALQATGREE